MIIEEVLLMWVRLYDAGYRPPPRKPRFESWLEFLDRADGVVEVYNSERRI